MAISAQLLMVKKMRTEHPSKFNVGKVATITMLSMLIGSTFCLPSRGAYDTAIFAVSPQEIIMVRHTEHLADRNRNLAAAQNEPANWTKDLIREDSAAVPPKPAPADNTGSSSARPDSSQTPVSSSATAASASIPKGKRVNLKVAYVNLQLIKSRFPDSLAAQQSRLTSENTLRSAVERGNAELQKMQDEGKSKDEITERSKGLKAEVNAMQQALIQLTQTQEATAQAKIEAAAVELMRIENADILVDGSGVFAGGEMVTQNGADLTAKLAQKLGIESVDKPTDNKMKSYSTTIGRFSLATIKSTPRFRAIDAYRLECENNLRKQVETGNANLKSARAAGKQTAELQEMAKTLQQSLAQLQQDSMAEIKRRTDAASGDIVTVASEISRSAGLELILTNESVIAGGAVIKENAVDVTDQVAASLSK